MSIIRFLTSKVFFKNLLISIILLVFILAGVFIGLYFYTNHGKSEIVPDLRGLNEPQIKRILDKQELRYEIIDSVFTDSVPNGTLWEQVPGAGSKVKKHRKLFLIFNAQTKKSIAMPDIRDLSLRQAKTVLESAGLKIGDTIYVPSEFKNLVIGQHYEGMEIDPGKPVTEGSRIDVLVANGLSSETTLLPDLKNMYLVDAEKILTAKGLNIGASIITDDEQDENITRDSLYVLNQKPLSRSKVNIGSSVTLWLTADSLKLKTDSLNTDSLLYE
ncbi:PASTA domain-containing protein [Saccharicrinis sp. FJH54]|uniref:PASTA domain-containing protein n=1 Tax=Saccharicrinis sp. FJH54 TaxID=3344665 RepID=UPI0035D5131B